MPILPRVYNQNIRVDIKKRRLFIEGSPRFQVTIADLISGAQMLYGFENDANIRKYLPLNWLRIVNDSGQDLKIYVGQSNPEIIKNNSIFTQNGNYWSFLLENIGSGTATGTLIYTHVQRKPVGGE